VLGFLFLAEPNKTEFNTALPMNAQKDINDIIRANILAAGGSTSVALTTYIFFGKECTNPLTASRCGLLLYSDHFFTRGICCEECYQRMLSLMPSRRTFLDRVWLFAELTDTGIEGCCLIHPHKPKGEPVHNVRFRNCCHECRAGHVQEFDVMARRYLLMGHMGLPRELAQVIMWFVIRV
jgi:hypothetical protein